MNPAELAEVRARFNAGTETRADFRALLSHAETTPSVAETMGLLDEAGDYWDRVVMATNPQTGAYPIRLAVGGPDWREPMTREQQAIEAGRRG